jgi:hypothetical protein
VLAALIFLAILVPAVIEGLTIANRVSVVTERSAVAGELAENKLNELLVDGTSTNPPSSSSSVSSPFSSSASSSASSSSDSIGGSGGDFGDEWPGYRWESTEEAWDQDDTMTELDVQVFFHVQGQEHSVTLSTLVSGSSQTVSGL